MHGARRAFVGEERQQRIETHRTAQQVIRIGVLADSMRSMAGDIAGHVGQLERSVAEATLGLKDALGSLSAIAGNIADGLLVVRGGVILQHNPALLRMWEKRQRGYRAMGYRISTKM